MLRSTNCCGTSWHALEADTNGIRIEHLTLDFLENNLPVQLFLALLHTCLPCMGPQGAPSRIKQTKNNGKQ